MIKWSFWFTWGPFRRFLFSPSKIWWPSQVVLQTFPSFPSYIRTWPWQPPSPGHPHNETPWSGRRIQSSTGIIFALASQLQILWRLTEMTDGDTLPETNITWLAGNPPFLIGDTSSNGGFPSAILVYRSVDLFVGTLLPENLRNRSPLPRNTWWIREHCCFEKMVIPLWKIWEICEFHGCVS